MEWLPIESAPKDGTRILLASPETVTVGWWSETGDYSYSTGKHGPPCWYGEAWVDYDHNASGWPDDEQPAWWAPITPVPARQG